MTDLLRMSLSTKIGFDELTHFRLAASAAVPPLPLNTVLRSAILAALNQLKPPFPAVPHSIHPVRLTFRESEFALLTSWAKKRHLTPSAAARAALAASHLASIAKRDEQGGPEVPREPVQGRAPVASPDHPRHFQPGASRLTGLPRIITLMVRGKPHWVPLKVYVGEAVGDVRLIDSETNGWSAEAAMARLTESDRRRARLWGTKEAALYLAELQKESA